MKLTTEERESVENCLYLGFFPLIADGTANVPIASLHSARHDKIADVIERLATNITESDLGTDDGRTMLIGSLLSAHLSGVQTTLLDCKDLQYAIPILESEIEAAKERQDMLEEVMHNE